jgi:hypothetical protein
MFWDAYSGLTQLLQAALAWYPERLGQDGTAGPAAFGDQVRPYRLARPGFTGQVSSLHLGSGRRSSSPGTSMAPYTWASGGSAPRAMPLAAQGLRGPPGDSGQILPGGLAVERAAAVGQQLAYHRHAPHRDRPALDQVTHQFRQLRS